MVKKGDPAPKKRQDFHLLAEKQSPPASQERAKVDCKFEDEYAIFPKDLDGSNIKQFLEQCPDGQSLGKAHFEVKTQQHLDDSPKKLRSPKHRPVVCDYRNRLNKSSSSFPSQSTLSDAELVVLLSRDDDGASNCSSSQEEKRLESCLKKNNFTKARNFRVVKFDLLDEDEKKLRPKAEILRRKILISCEMRGTQTLRARVILLVLLLKRAHSFVMESNELPDDLCFLAGFAITHDCLHPSASFFNMPFLGYVVFQPSLVSLL
ncbi:hypothetical protein NC652_039219 [Populus alba x Populus x berolinensis]|nr:hypothetical protein NC652_039219 [Populus alba x Populus x berolinensis]